MQNSKYLAAALAVCLTLSGCANRETQQTASVSSTGGGQVSSSLPSSQAQQTSSDASAEAVEQGQTSSSEPEQQTQEPDVSAASDAAAEAVEQGQASLQSQQEQTSSPEPDVSGGVDAAGVSSSAQEEKWAEAEEVLMDIYKPMIDHFPLLIDEDNPLSAEEAYEIFQGYYICRRYHTIENYEQWVIGDQHMASIQNVYYVQDIAEQFIQERLGVSAEEMRSIEAYNPEVKGYLFSMYSGKDWSTLIIVDRQQEGDLYTFDFTYTMYGYEPPARCQLTLKDEAGVFSLHHYAGEAIPYSPSWMQQREDEAASASSDTEG